MSAFHHSTTSVAALIVCAVLVLDVEGRHHFCPPFSCGALSNISDPFRRQGDPSGCGAYELVCTDTTATFPIGSGTYNLVDINYKDSYFWVVDANMGIQSSCPLPRWGLQSVNPVPDDMDDTRWAIFLNCSRPIEKYERVGCLSTNSSFIYLMTSLSSYVAANSLETSCGYLAMKPLGGVHMTVPENISYPDVVKFMRKGFTLEFPFMTGNLMTECLEDSMRYLIMPDSLSGNKIQIWHIFTVDFYFWDCLMIRPTTDFTITTIIFPLAMFTLKDFYVMCRFILMPLAVFMFLAYKYWKTRITIDAVEKFLQMQQILVPMRYAYTDIIAITSHFRDKLGQGGYGSVYKGVLLPGEIHIAIKMLSNSKCNGEEFISEVATIGRIHHVNVVQLVGFCSEESRRALIYEFMPNGSLDKHIFSSERSFSWDKLNEIALGIARGINYLHQGCDMQIVHFDIKPHNILLDNNFVPKVADFGLAKLFPRDHSFVPLSAMRGTIGYIAPEMISRSFGVISTKSDVYSFGMLLLEMTGGRRNVDPHAGSSTQVYYPSWVYSKLSQDGGVDMHESEKKLCLIGLWCIQMKPQDRPTMSEVIEMLELEAGVDGIQMSPRPFFCDDEVDGGSYYSASVPSELDTIDASELDTIEEEEEEE